ncbi:hypothetical protein KI387_011391, partial [Taxus chinensis]
KGHGRHRIQHLLVHSKRDHKQCGEQREDIIWEHSINHCVSQRSGCQMHLI